MSDRGDPVSPARRQALQAGGLGLGTALLGLSSTAQPVAASPAAVDEGSVVGERVEFAPIQAGSERPGLGPPNADPPAKRVGFAIMGLGRLALENILPAFSECRHARPVALISGDTAKMRTVARQYSIPANNCFSYAEFDRIRAHPEIEVVYVVLPNSLHHDAVVRAARAGKHVLCEKPMATNPDEARSMVEACKSADRRLMIAYRCQYEIYNRDLARRARAGELGQIQLIDAVNTQNQGDPAQWRHVKALSGGGSLPDIGLYCLNTARALLGEEPFEVSATSFSPVDDPRFREVESTVAFTLRFPSGAIANCASSYSAHEQRSFRVFGSMGSADVVNAFAYQGQHLQISRREHNAEVVAQFSLAQKNQFSLEIDHMAECVRGGVQPRTPGEEGLQDQVIMAAIYESVRVGLPVKLPRITSLDTFRGALPSA